MKLTVNVPNTVPLAVIEGALRALGATIVQRKAKAQEQEYPPLVYKKRIRTGHSEAQHYLDANPDALQDDDSIYLRMEMDGISVLKAIRKIASARMAYNKADGRTAKQFPEFGEHKTTAEYVAAMESEWNLHKTVQA